MTRFMRKDMKAATMAAAPPDKAASYEIGEDESGMRLDRWLHRRFPDVANSHLMRIVRKGEVRVSGKRADISTRLATGESVRVPPLRIAMPEAPAISQASPGDADAIRAMTLFEDRDCLCSTSLTASRSRAARGRPAISTACFRPSPIGRAIGLFSFIAWIVTRQAFS